MEFVRFSAVLMAASGCVFCEVGSYDTMLIETESPLESGSIREVDVRLVTADLDVGDRHGVVQAGVSTGATGNLVPTAGLVGAAKVGWVGWPELELVLSPVVGLQQPPVMAHVEGWLGWSALLGGRRVALDGAVWMLPGGGTTRSRRDVLPRGVTVGVGWSSRPDRLGYDAFIGVQRTRWDDVIWTLPRVRLHVHPGEHWFVGTDLGPAQTVVQVGWGRRG